ALPPAAPHAARDPHPRGHARPGDGFRAGRRHLHAASAQLRPGLPPRGALGRARRGRPRPHAADGQQPHHAELRRDHRGWRRQPRRRDPRRPAHRARGGHHDHLLSRGERGGDLPHHARRAGRAAARAARPGGPLRMMRRENALMLAGWIVLALLPLWLPYVGGYTALGTKVQIYGMGVMALNLLLGFAGGLSFGHAAYFGLGAYGAGMTLKYLALSTPLALRVGTLAGGLAATVLGPLVMRRRGIYFAMITIAIGQLLYFVMVRWNNVTGGEDGLAGFSRQDIHLGPLVIPIASSGSAFYYLVLACFTVAVALLWMILQSPLGHTFVAIRENRRRVEFLGIRVERYVWAAFAIAGFITAFAGALNAL